MQEHPRILFINSRGCRMLLPGLLFDAVSKITSLMFSIPFIGFQCHIGFNTRSHLCHCSLSEGGPRFLSELLHKYTPSYQLRTSSDSFHFMCQPQTESLSEKVLLRWPLGPEQSRFDICSINSTPSFRQALKTHLFKSYFVSN